jgi:hypothetical protein
MALIINGSAEDRATILDWLKQICRFLTMDSNGNIHTELIRGEGPTRPPDDWISGCDCIRTICNSHRTVTIQPLPKPTSPVPGSGAPPSSSNPAGKPDNTIGEAGGGSTTYSPADPLPGKNFPPACGYDDDPGKGSDGQVGSDATVYIDMSNNGKNDGTNGYPDHDQVPKPNNGSPMWLILAHELTTGHAYHIVNGTMAFSIIRRETQAQSSENRHRAAHKLPIIPGVD